MWKLSLTTRVVWLKHPHQTEASKANGGWLALIRSSTTSLIGLRSLAFQMENLDGSVK